MSNLSDIGDTLLDDAMVKSRQIRAMNDAIDVYKRAVMFLGYCSQLKEYSVVFENIFTKLMLYRGNIIRQHKFLLLEQNIKIFKTLLIPPMKTHWYTKGIIQYHRITKHCIWAYRKKLQRAIDTQNEKHICQIIDTIIMVDRHYDIYKDTIVYFAEKNETVASIIQAKYMSYIQL